MTEESLFELALNTSPEERPALLDRACEGNAELRALIERLLTAHDQSHAAVDRRPDLAATADSDESPLNAFATTRTAPPARESVGASFGRYTLEKLLGEGGMGSVWVAKQSEPVKRKVALKLIKTGMDSRSVLQRFEAERQALAVMDHPNIARVFDGGLLPDGRPFFAMELIDGLPINKFCDDAKIPTRERLELFVKVCQAVQHAHQKGIIHRDLKPANVLVTMVDGRPEPKVIDFGVAKAVGGKLHDLAETTQFGAIVGTLEYMAPEQAGYSNTDIDTRADVYALGVILYELLTGLRPFDSQRLKKAALDEVIRIIREEEPSKPSTRLSSSESLPSSAAVRHSDPQRLLRSLRGDLDWIALKCLEKDRNRRYETANGLAADILRHLADEPVQASPPSAGYRFKKWARRNKTGIVVALSIWAITAAAGGFAAVQYSKAEAARKTADEERGKAETAAEKEKDQRVLAEKAGQEALEAYRASTDEAIQQLIGAKPSFTEVERRYLQTTLERWRAFADRKGDDPSSQEIRGEGHLRIGQIFEMLGNFREAQTEYRAALDCMERLCLRFPNDPVRRKLRALAQVSLGVLFRHIGDVPNARAQFAAATATYKELAERDPESDAYRIGLHDAHRQMAYLLGSSGELDASRTEYHAATEIARKLVADHPDDERHQLKLVQILSAYGNHLGLQVGGKENNRAAVTALREALAIQRKLAGSRPEAVNLQSVLIAVLSNLGNSLRTLGEVEEAGSVYEEACRTGKRIAERFPLDQELQVNLGGYYCNLGLHYRQAGNTTAALSWLDKAVATLSPIIAKTPEDVTAAKFLRNSLVNRATAYEKLKRHSDAEKDLTLAIPLERGVEKEELITWRAYAQINAGATEAAVATLDQFVEAPDSPPDHLWYLAMMYANASLKVESRRDAYADRAVAFLKRTVSAGLKSAEDLLDPRLGALHSRDDFRAAFDEAAKRKPEARATALAKLARSLWERKHAAKAVATAKEAIAVQEAAIAKRPDDERLREELADFHDGMGSAFLGSGDLEAAERCHRLAFEVRSKLHLESKGPRKAEFGQQAAWSIHNLGMTQFKRGRFEAAAEGFGKAAAERAKLFEGLPAVHRFRIAATRDLDWQGRAWSEARRWPEAVRAYQAALDAREAMMNFNFADQERRSDVDWSQQRLAEALIAAGKPADAAEVLKRNVDLYRKTNPQGLPDVLENYGWRLMQAGKFKEAEGVYREMLGLREKSSSGSWSVGVASSLVGESLLHQKKYAEAEPFLLKGFQTLKAGERTIPPTLRIRLPEAAGRLVWLYAAMNKPDEAKKWQAEQEKCSVVQPRKK